MMKNQQKENYKKLLALMPFILEIDEGHATLTAPGFMDLEVEVLFREGSKISIALSHYYTQNSDLIPDPDMELVLDTEAETVAAISYQDSFAYQRIEGRPQYASSLDRFLGMWLSNLKAQGHTIREE